MKTTHIHHIKDTIVRSFLSNVLLRFNRTGIKVLHLLSNKGTERGISMTRTK